MRAVVDEVGGLCGGTEGAEPDRAKAGALTRLGDWVGD